MPYPPLRIVMRLVKSDIDIISLLEYYGMKYVVTTATHHYLGDKTSILTLPPLYEKTKLTYYSTIFHRGDDESTYDFLSSLPDKDIFQILKRLIRHATMDCDIRQFLIQQDSVSRNIAKSFTAPETNIKSRHTQLPGKDINKPQTQKKTHHRQMHNLQNKKQNKLNPINTDDRLKSNTQEKTKAPIPQYIDSGKKDNSNSSIFDLI